MSTDNMKLTNNFWKHPLDVRDPIGCQVSFDVWQRLVAYQGEAYRLVQSHLDEAIKSQIAGQFTKMVNDSYYDVFDAIRQNVAKGAQEYAI